MTATLTIQGLEVRYGDNVALTGVDLELPAGSSLAVATTFFAAADAILLIR